MTTSCGPSVMPEGSVVRNTASTADISESATQAREIALVQSHISEYIHRLMPGPASIAGRYQVETGGSLLRARLALASGRAFGCSGSYRIAAAAACELIHNASLVHDDLLDRDEARRDSVSVWKRFGDGIALCAGDLLLCAAFGVAADLENPEESRLLSQNLAAQTGRVIVGQSIELAGSRDQPSPRFRAYLEATGAKTVPLIELPLMTGAVAGGADQSVQNCIRRLASATGLAYQITDDLDDLHAGRPVLHPYHAWHHHRGGHREDPHMRIRKAIQHAIAALDRARRLIDKLEALEPGVRKFLSPTLNPLLAKLEQRSLAHSQHFPSAGESSTHDQVVAV